MLENYWRRADSSPSTREHFLMALSDIQYILVKASFTRNTEESRIEDVRLDIASTTGLGARAYDVEQVYKFCVLLVMKIYHFLDFY